MEPGASNGRRRPRQCIGDERFRLFLPKRPYIVTPTPNTRALQDVLQNARLDYLDRAFRTDAMESRTFLGSQRAMCTRMSLPAIDRHPAPRSLCFACCPSFTRCRPSSTRYASSSRGTPSPIAVGNLQLSGAVRTSTTSELSLFRAARRTKAGAEASLPRVSLPPRAVLRPCAQLRKRQGSAPPAHGRSSFLGSCSRVLSGYVVVAAQDSRNVPPLPLKIWPQVTHADAARWACSCCCCWGVGGLSLVQ